MSRIQISVLIEAFVRDGSSRQELGAALVKAGDCVHRGARWSAMSFAPGSEPVPCRLPILAPVKEGGTVSQVWKAETGSDAELAERYGLRLAQNVWVKMEGATTSVATE